MDSTLAIIILVGVIYLIIMIGVTIFIISKKRGIFKQTIDPKPYQSFESNRGQKEK